MSRILVPALRAWPALFFLTIGAIVPVLAGFAPIPGLGAAADAISAQRSDSVPILSTALDGWPLAERGCGHTLDLPSSAIKIRDGVTFYGIIVFAGVFGSLLCIHRRYSEFHALHECLDGSTYSDAPFPTTVFMMSVVTRRKALQLWLHRVVEQSQIASHWRKPVRTFLGRDLSVQ